MRTSLFSRANLRRAAALSVTPLLMWPLWTSAFAKTAAPRLPTLPPTSASAAPAASQAPLPPPQPVPVTPEPPPPTTTAPPPPSQPTAAPAPTAPLPALPPPNSEPPAQPLIVPPTTPVAPAPPNDGTRPVRLGFQTTLRFAVAFPLLNENAAGDAGSRKLSDDFGFQFPLTVEVGARLSPEIFVGGYGSVAFGGGGGFWSDYCGADGTCHSYDFRVGGVVHYHFMPTASVDPWVGIGLGWEFSRLNVSTTDESFTLGLSGPEIPILVGVDWRSNEYVAFGPFLSTHIGEYLTYDQSGGTGDSAGSFPNKAIHMWLMGGLRAVFLP